MESNKLVKYFGAADFAVFSASLILSVLIGVYFGYKDKNKKSTETYYFGDRNLSPAAVGMSMAVSFVSAITVLGYPVEIYYYGILSLWQTVASILATAVAMIYFIPLIFRLQLKSMYEYLELRYNKYVRRLCCGVFIVDLILYMGNTIYLPALALNSVTPLELEWSIAVTSVICTFYTTLGGIKAVIWTDVLQGFIMGFGSLALFVKATIDVGGLDVVFDTARRGGRLNFFTFESDFRLRTTAQSYFLGYFILAATTTSFSQVFAQRYLSCKSVRNARKAALIRNIPLLTFTLLAAASGLAMHAYYDGCDPYAAGYVTKMDQLTPRFAIEIFKTLPGLAGLFVAAAYSGTLSTVSSGINSLAAVTTEDFIDPFCPGMSMSRKYFLAKVLTVSYGFLVMCVAYAVSQLQANIVQISFSVAGVGNGSIFAVFIMGTMCPWINAKGAFGGIIVGSFLPAWCALGRTICGVSRKFAQKLPFSVEECYVNATASTDIYGFTNWTTASPTMETRPDRPVLEDTLYAISPFLYGFIGFVIASIFMIIISALTGFNKPSDMMPQICVPLVDNKTIFSKGIIKFFRCGVPEIPEKKTVGDAMPHDVVKTRV